MHGVGTCTAPTQPAGINAPDGSASVRAQLLAVAFAGSQVSEFVPPQGC